MKDPQFFRGFQILCGSPFHWLQHTWPRMAILRSILFCAGTFGAKLGFRSLATLKLTCSKCCRRTLNQKQQLWHRAVPLRQHGFLVCKANSALIVFLSLLHVDISISWAPAWTCYPAIRHLVTTDVTWLIRYGISLQVQNIISWKVKTVTENSSRQLKSTYRHETYKSTERLSQKHY